MFKRNNYLLPKFESGIDLIKFRQKYPEFGGLPDNLLLDKIKSNPQLLKDFASNPFDSASTALGTITNSFSNNNDVKSLVPTVNNTAGNVSAGINAASALGSTAIDLFSKPKEFTDAYGNTEKVNTNQAFKGALGGASFGANPVLATATGGASIAVGAGLGTIFGALSQDAQEKKALKQKNEADAMFISDKLQEGRDKVKSFKLQGYGTKGISQYAKGGQLTYSQRDLNNKPLLAKGGAAPEYEAELDEVVQGNNVNLEEQQDLASDITKVGGYSHEEGGTLGSGGDRIFSDRIKLTDDITLHLKSKGFNVKGTHADAATKLGKLKGKYEDKLSNHNSITYNTGKVMLARIDETLDELFEHQEMLKQEDMLKKNNKYAKGGVLPKYRLGIEIPKELEDELNPDVSRVNPMETNILGKDLFKLGNDNLPQLANLAAYAKNVSDVNKLGTNINRVTPTPTFMKAPNYLNKNLNEISGAVRNTYRNIDNSSASIQDAFSRKAAIFSKGLEAKNDATMKQGLIEADINNKNTSIANQFAAMKASNRNQDALDKLEGRNDILSGKISARNALLQGIMGNQATKRAYDTDKIRLKMEALRDGDRGVYGRTNEKLYQELINDGYTPQQIEKILGIKKKAMGGKLSNKSIMKGYC